PAGQAAGGGRAGAGLACPAHWRSRRGPRRSARRGGPPGASHPAARRRREEASPRRPVQSPEVRLDQRAVVGGDAVGVGLQQVLAQPGVLAEQVARQLRRRRVRHVLAAPRLALGGAAPPVDRALRDEHPRRALRRLGLELVARLALADGLLRLLHVLLRLIQPAEQAVLLLLVAADLLELLADAALLVGEAAHLGLVALRHRQLLRHLARDLARAVVQL